MSTAPTVQDVPTTSDSRRIAVLRAQKSATLALREGPRPLAEYMALPASQYSVLDAKRIERIDDDTFRCYVGGLKLFNFAVYPVLTVSVIVTERGPTVKLLSTKLEGSPAVVAANDRFTATMTNDVRWNTGPAPDLLELGSDTSIQVALEVPGWFQMVPVSAIERTGCSVMQRVLNKMVPKFLKQLQADYELWASGDGSRKPIGDGQL
ncbi:g408 [Coccomyxa elongata]